MVPVAECSWPTVTSVSVTASLVVLTCAVGGAAAWPRPGMAARPPSGSGGALQQAAALELFGAQIGLAGRHAVLLRGWTWTVNVSGHSAPKQGCRPDTASGTTLVRFEVGSVLCCWGPWSGARGWLRIRHST